MPTGRLGETRFQTALRRWALRYCPWVGLEGVDGLVLDVTGSAHLLGGETAMLDDMRARADRAGLSLRLGLADTRGAAWALARHGDGNGIVAPGQTLSGVGPLPVAALRLDPDIVTKLQRLGLRHIADLAATARAPLGRRFGPTVLTRLDQALGDIPEQISPKADPPHYGVRLTLPEPIGLFADVMAGTARLLDRLCHKLALHEVGTRRLILTLRRVDQASQQVELRLAGAMRNPARILPLFERGIAGVEAGFGIDRMRLEAVEVAPLPAQQISSVADRGPDQLNDLITRLGTRIGLENIHRFPPAPASPVPARADLRHRPTPAGPVPLARHDPDHRARHRPRTHCPRMVV
ncbi:Y-family DNA polymerase [Halovulum sp. GXIMD14793]